MCDLKSTSGFVGNTWGDWGLCFCVKYLRLPEPRWDRTDLTPPFKKTNYYHETPVIHLSLVLSRSLSLSPHRVQSSLLLFSMVSMWCLLIFSFFTSHITLNDSQTDRTQYYAEDNINSKRKNNSHKEEK